MGHIFSLTDSCKTKPYPVVFKITRTAICFLDMQIEELISTRIFIAAHKFVLAVSNETLHLTCTTQWFVCDKFQATTLPSSQTIDQEANSFHN